MIPLSDENPTRTTPYVTYILIALNILIFMIDRIGAEGFMGNLWQWSMIPRSVIEGVRYEPMISQQGQIAFIARPGTGIEPQWITIFTSMFMHGGIMHIIGNMWFLWIFGNNIEDVLGRFKFILFYVGAGVLAAMAHIWSNPMSYIPTVGASGAIAGVLGAYILLFPHNRINTLVWFYFFVNVIEVPAVFFLAIWFIGQITGVLGSYQTVGGGVAYWAHIGGFVAGIVLILIFGGRRLTRDLPPPRLRRRDTGLSPWED